MNEAPRSILILGAGSDIGAALAEEAAKAGFSLVLAARSPAMLAELAGRLGAVHGVAVEIHAFDAVDVGRHGAFLDHLSFLPAIAICLVGYLGQQTPSQQRGPEINLLIDTNLTGPASILHEIAARMEARGYGALVGVSSVAGDRGRAANYFYGAAKAGLATFLSGLRQRVAHSNVRVVTVKLGPIRTKMTAHLKSAILADPKTLAPSLLAACLKSRGEVYLPRYWRPVMLVIRAMPDWLFIRLCKF
jgi:decaprenylphospho-beta-D-erythro-pentofuranosid-2-ulose 2-reductase